MTDIVSPHGELGEEMPRTAEEGARRWADSLGATQDLGGEPLPPRRLVRLRASIQRSRDRLSQGRFEGQAGRAAEWLLDNAWLVQRTIDLVEESLPRGFCRRLPATASGVARVELLAWQIVHAGNSWVEPDSLRRWVLGVQNVEPLTIGEIWALPAMVRWALLEDLAASAGDAAGLPPLDTPRPSTLVREPEPLRVAACIQSLRLLERHDWNAFLKATSVVEASLRRDPSGAYAHMAFESQDRYRKAVEELARRSPSSESEVAKAALRLCRQQTVAPSTGDEAQTARRRHVGFWLVEEGREQLEIAVGFKAGPMLRARRWLRPWKVAIYLASLAGATATIAIGFAAPALSSGAWTVVAALGICLLPASAVAVAAVHWLVTVLVEPRVLPKLDFDAEPPPEAATLIVLPAILGDAEETRTVLATAESNWLGNGDAVLGMALLFDYRDAPEATLPDDPAALRRVAEGIRALNRRHGDSVDQGPFLLLLRDREWSDTEQQWMGWERKRGKLHDINQLALGLPSRLRVEVGDPDLPSRARFAITLDADTILPPESARRLIGTLAHPLNRAVFDSTGRLVAGYTVLQPRVEITPWSAVATPFARIFCGERGLDLYSRAVSDVYQDLFGEGNYVGKGIYDIAAFHRSLNRRVPDGSLLSHDLFEGLQGRAGLVSDVAALEDFPGHILSFVRRGHRWTRGDWQLAPWLLPRVPVPGGGRSANRLTLLGKWKIIDNLRRSLLRPALVVMLLAGWIALPGSDWWWTLLPALVLGITFTLGTLSAARVRLRRGRFLGTPRGWVVARIELTRWGVALALLAYQAGVDLDATIRALWRMLVTRRRLLEWTPAYQTERIARENRRVGRDMVGVPLLAAAVGALLGLPDPGRLSAAGPVLALWMFSPFLVQALSRRDIRREPAFSSVDRRRLRGIARRTWSFFESVLGPDNHWLPPDHVQEALRAKVARRTSPTNIGLSAAASLAAWDFGYLSSERLVAITENLFDTLDHLERHRGHFFNWYDSHRLSTLAPRYVSTVDSGNLACSLVALARGLEAMRDQPLPRVEAESEGLVDAVEALRETVRRRGWEDVDTTAFFAAIDGALENLDGPGLDVGNGSARSWRQTLDRFIEHHMVEIAAEALALAESGTGKVDARDLTILRESLRGLRHQASTLRQESASLLPWLKVQENGLRGAIQASGLPERVALVDVPAACRQIRQQLLPGSAASMASNEDDRADLLRRLQAAEQRSLELTDKLRDLAKRADAFATAMDFGFLYDPSQRLFHIGYDADAGRFDPSWYDLLASEARTASFFAIATGAVPIEHWVHLGRPFARARGQTVLLSWAGTLFEYLMPDLFLPNPRGSLLDFAVRRAVRRQIAFGRHHRVPWGISESGYDELDAHGGYRYHAFGVPDLALRREPETRIVIAPYASCLAASLQPSDVARNIEHLQELGALGPRGLYEAIDYGSSGTRRSGNGRIVRSYMAHHQAMILLALDNALLDTPMVKRFLADPRMGAVAFLLYENTPERVLAHSSLPTPPETPQPPAAQQVDPGTWGWTELAERPRVQILSNGRWSTLISDRGSGGARMEEFALTRWRGDPTVDRWGSWIYLQDLDSRQLWSATARPTYPLPRHHEVVFAPHFAEFHRHELGIFSRLLVCVAAQDDVELRRLYLRNDSSRPRRLGLTSYGEVALARQAEDRRHPAYAKLFVESRFDAADRTLFFRRRGDGLRARLAHSVTLSDSVSLVGWDSDRARFLGRTGRPSDPEGLRRGPAGLSRTQGATLDPVFALGCEVVLQPGQEARVTFLTAVGSSEADAQAAMDGFRSKDRIDWAIREVRERTAAEMAAKKMAGRSARHAQTLLCGLVYPCRSLRRAITKELERPQQEELWSIGVSGDRPVMLLRVARPEDKGETMEVLRAHSWLRARRVRADLVVLDESSGGYADTLHGWLQRVVATTHGSDALGRDGGVHYVPMGRLAASTRSAIEAASAVILDTEAGGLEAQLQSTEMVDRLPPFVAVPSSPTSERPTPPLPPTEGLRFDHRHGGLSADMKTYVMRVEHELSTPAPWCNVVANPGFGFLVSERGSGFSWAQNSGERRLTPWNNDPVQDPPGEVVYVRDEETGEVWSATPAPAGVGAPYEVRHGAGFSEFTHRRHGLEHQMCLFVATDEPVKILRLHLTDLWQRPRRLTVTFYVEWTLGHHRDLSAPHVVTELAGDDGAILARERFAADYAGRFAFIASSESLHGFTADRREFLGDGGTERPAGLARIGLSGASGAGLDPCGAIQVHIDLAAGGARYLHFVLGESQSRDKALALVRKWRAPQAAQDAEAEARATWDERLGRLTVRTPEPAMDALLNRWLPYQTRVCRLWARSAFYQSSGAFGFRDQLQDSLAFLTTEPDLTRRQILACAQRQFEQGDVLHWWHPPDAAGPRTRCSDDLVWLPYAIASYFAATADRSILDVRVPFLTGAELSPTEEQRYDHWPESGETGSKSRIYEHGRRALERAWTVGRHGLPLIGDGDWNDGMNHVGSGGSGESVWLGWFLLATARAWMPLCESEEGPEAATALRRKAESLRWALEEHGWDGAWYRRAYYDDGTPLGTAEADEARIDSISQSWAVLSGAADADRAGQAIESAMERLVRPNQRLALLLDPPFDRGQKDPGYIKAYPPGVRENGGQYTHAAIWLAWALADLGDGDRAEAMFQLLNPLLRARSDEEIARYRVEPYVVAADVYSAPPHTGRGGWTWYTGSSGWLWRLGTERILGIVRRGGRLVVDPCIPRDWPGFEATVLAEEVEVLVRVENPDHASRGIAAAVLDGEIVDEAAVPLDSPGRYELVVRLGDSPVA